MRIRPRDEASEIRDRLEALGPAPDAAGLEDLVAWATERRRRQHHVTAEVVAAFDRDPSIATYRLANNLLPRLGEDSRLKPIRQTMQARRPDLLLPWVADLEALMSAYRPKHVRALLDTLLDRPDPSGADLDVLIRACFITDIASDLRRVADYIDAFGQPSLVTETSYSSRLRELLDIVDHPTDDDARFDSWTGRHEDRVFAFQVALVLKDGPALLALCDGIRPSDLPVPQLSRAAVQLWRAGANDRGLELARSVPVGPTAASRRAQTVIGEFESFELMDSGWRLPERRGEVAYEPASGSVLHVLHNSLPYRRTGAANRTQGLLAGLVDQGYSITGLTPPGFPFGDVPADAVATIEERHEIDGVVYQHLFNDGVVLPRFPVQTFISTYADGVVEHARRESAALIHAASNSYNALAALTAARELGIPAIYEVRGLYEEVRRSRNAAYAATTQYRFASYLETMAATEADRVITITGGLRDTLVERGVPADKIVVVPNGVDTHRFQPLPRDEALAGHYSLEDATVIGYIGSLNWYEGHELLFEAFARLHLRHPEARLLIVGEGSHLNTLLRLRARLGLEDAILMPGSIPFEQVEAHYSLIDIAPITRLSSPVTETVSPLKPFEAMAMGKAVLSSDVAIMTEIIDHEHTGLLFAKGDVESLENALERLLSEPALRESLGARAREWVVAERDWKILARLVAATYRDLGVRIPEA